MLPRRTAVIALALGLVACGSDASTEPNVPCPAAHFEVAEVNGLRLPVTVEVGADTLPDGRVVTRITRLESGTVTLDGDDRVSLRLATYHRHQTHGVNTDQLVGLTSETDRGLVSYRTPALNAALSSHQVGDLMHWFTPTANGPVLTFRLGGTNTVLGLGLVTAR
jgi:hypothetical protein